MVPDFTYDVAFSFLAEDEDLATTLAERLKDRLSTFLYSKRQSELVGTDGERALNAVFQRDSRLVVVLYRKTWGETPWTRVEATAIRNRGLERGYDFLVLIPAEVPPVAPDWLPRARIWFDIDRFGVDGAVAVIETRVADAGGDVRAETPAERAARLQRRLDFDSQRDTFLNSDRGVREATKSVSTIFDALETQAQKVSKISSALRATHQRKDRELAIQCRGYSVSLYWHLQYANVLRCSNLLVKFWRGHMSLSGRVTFDEPEELSSEYYKFDLAPLAPNETTGWRSQERALDPMLSPAALADRIMHELLALIEQDGQ